MSAATGPLTTGQRQGEIIPVALASAVQVYKGAAAAVVTGIGYGTPLVPATSTHQFIGVWNESVLSASPAGTTFTQVLRRGVFQFDQSGLTAANMNQRLYFSDDHTVTNVPGTTYAGILCCVDANGKAWVDIEGAVRDSTSSNSGTHLGIVAPILTTNVAGVAQTMATLTLAANSLGVGDRIKLRGELIGTTRTSTDTCALQLLMGSTTIATLPTAFAHAATNFLTFDLELVVRTIGASGTMVGTGYYGAGTAGATIVALDLASTAIDTTIAEAFKIIGTFSANNQTDAITVNIFDLDIVRN